MTATDAKHDLVVVGAGIVALAAARELLARRPGLKLAILEREPEVARHQTGSNSGVIHGGIYYAPGSLKARLCVEGAAKMYAYCEARRIPYERCGKVIVALADRELPGLDALEARGRANGVPGLRRVGREELAELEPHAAGIAALHSPVDRDRRLRRRCARAGRGRSRGGRDDRHGVRGAGNRAGARAAGSGPSQRR